MLAFSNFHYVVGFELIFFQQQMFSDILFLFQVYSGNYWISKGMPKSKVVIGIPLYGHSYKLLFAFDHGLHAPASDRGPNDGYVNYPYVRKYFSFFL